MITNIAITLLAISIILVGAGLSKRIKDVERECERIDRQEYGYRILKIESLLFDPPRNRQSETGQFSVDGQEVEVGDLITGEYVASAEHTHGDNIYSIDYLNRGVTYVVGKMFWNRTYYFTLNPLDDCTGMSFVFKNGDYVKGIKIAKKGSKK